MKSGIITTNLILNGGWTGESLFSRKICFLGGKLFDRVSHPFFV
jgi:hypothetical protein